MRSTGRRPAESDAGASPELSLWQRGATDPGRLAIVDPDGSEWTYGALTDASHQVANGLVGLGVGSGDVVAAVLGNDHAVYEIFSATMQSGAYYLPVNFHLTSEDIQFILEDSDATVVFAGEAYADVVLDAARAAGLADDRVVVVGSGSSDYAAFKAAQPKTPPSRRSPGQRLYYTSGTTGRPKGVRKKLPEGDPDLLALRSSQYVFVNNGFPVGPDGAHLVAGPTYHAAPLGCGMAALHQGQAVVLMGTDRRWSAEECLALIERYHVTSTHLVPTMFHRMLALASDVRLAYDLSSLRAVAHAAAPCPIATKRQMIDWLGPIINEYYAASEGGGTKVSSAEWLDRPGTVGKAFDGAAVRIIDDAGSDAPVGVPGRVYMLMTEPFEYHNDPEKTAATRSDGFFTVGDIGYLDEDGYLFLCDRDSNTIISGGVNIYPAEIEAVLMEHPLVADVAVIGVPNPEWGEEVKAVVEVQPDAVADAALGTELLAHCRSRLAAFKCPRTVDFTRELPRLENGKLYKSKLRDEYWAGFANRV